MRCFPCLDNRFARFGLQLGQRWMLEGGQEIVGKLALQTSVACAACIQNNEIGVTDILRLSSVIE